MSLADEEFGLGTRRLSEIALERVGWTRDSAHLSRRAHRWLRTAWAPARLRSRNLNDRLDIALIGCGG